MMRVLRYGFSFLKEKILSGTAVPTRVLRGPFRDAVVIVNRRDSLRKIFGLYEHELNSWLESAIPRVDRVLDVGANDGYFTFGCAAAFRRRGRGGEVMAFEPDEKYTRLLREAIAMQSSGAIRISLRQSLVGGRIGPGTTILDAIEWLVGDPKDRENTLLKIDVEGAELNVLNGARSWLNPSNLFVIEVHSAPLLNSITELFATHDLRLKQIDQRPLPFIGRDQRSRDNWWLVSDLRSI